jgi:hypothetical protein
VLSSSAEAESVQSFLKGLFKNGDKPADAKPVDKPVDALRLPRAHLESEAKSVGEAVRLECSVCMDPYDDKNKQPRLLNCAHSFCGECLQTMPKADAMLT